MATGFDTFALLAIRPEDGVYGRRLLPQERRFLVDHRKHPLAEPTTTDLAKARIWNEQSGPYAFMRRHPEMKGKFIAIAVPRPVAPAPAKAAG